MKRSTEINKDEGLTTEELTTKYCQEIADYFEIEKIEDIKITIFNSIEELWARYKECTGKEAPRFVKNFSPQGDAWGEVCLLKEGAADGNGRIRTKKDFNASLKHELVHTYQKVFYDQNNIDPRSVPRWLREGESLYLAGQKTFDPGQITIDRIRNADENDEDRYVVGLKIVSEIIRNYGKEKLFELVKIRDNEERIKELQKLFEWLK